MVTPLTPKPTRKAEALAKAPPTIASRREEDVALKKRPKPWLCCANGILETKAKMNHKKMNKFFIFYFSFSFYSW
jgi:hypothetical protein